MHKEIEEYKEFEDEIRNNIESQYQYHISIGDGEAAHEDVKNLMKYRLIDTNDMRVNPKTSLFGFKLDASMFGMWDYRNPNSLGFLKRFLYCNVQDYYVMKIDTLPHWGKRIEGSYSGDVKIKEYTAKFRVTQIGWKILVKGTLDKIKALCKAANKPLENYDELLELAEYGVIRLFEIRSLGNTIYQNRLPAFAMLHLNNDGKMEITTFINYEAVCDSWLDVAEFTREVGKAVAKMCDTETTINNYISLDNATNIQKVLIAKSNATEVEAKKAAERTEAIKKQKEEAKAEKEKNREKRKATTVIH